MVWVGDMMVEVDGDGHKVLAGKHDKQQALQPVHGRNFSQLGLEHGMLGQAVNRWEQAVNRQEQAWNKQEQAENRQVLVVCMLELVVDVLVLCCHD